MTETSKFPSLEKFQGALQSRSKLFDCPVDEDLLSKLHPTPYDAFQRALNVDGAQEPDINDFLKSLKALKFRDGDLVTTDGLIFLANTVWELQLQEPTGPSESNKRGRQQTADRAPAVTTAPTAKKPKKGRQAKRSTVPAQDDEVLPSGSKTAATAVIGAAAGTRRAKQIPDIAPVATAQQVQHDDPVPAQVAAERGGSASAKSAAEPDEAPMKKKPARSKGKDALDDQPVPEPPTQRPARAARAKGGVGERPTGTSKLKSPASAATGMATRMKGVATRGAQGTRSHNEDLAAPQEGSEGMKEGTASADKAPPKTDKRATRGSAPRSRSAAARSHTAAAGTVDSDMVEVPEAPSKAKATQKRQKGARREKADAPTTAPAAAVVTSDVVGDAPGDAAGPSATTTRPTSKRVAARASAVATRGPEQPVGQPVVEAATDKPEKRTGRRVRQAAKASREPDNAVAATARRPVADVTVAATVDVEDVPSKRSRKRSVKLYDEEEPAEAAAPVPTALQPKKRSRRGGTRASDDAVVAAAQPEVEQAPAASGSIRRSAVSGSASGAAGASAAAPAAAGAAAGTSPAAPPQPLLTRRQQAALKQTTATAAAAPGPVASQDVGKPAKKGAAKKAADAPQPQESKGAAPSKAAAKSTSNAKNGNMGSSDGEEAGSGARKSSRRPVPKKLFVPDQNFPPEGVDPAATAAMATSAPPARSKPARSSTAPPPAATAAAGGSNGAVAATGASKSRSRSKSAPKRSQRNVAPVATSRPSTSAAAKAAPKRGMRSLAEMATGARVSSQSRSKQADQSAAAASGAEAEGDEEQEGALEGAGAGTEVKANAGGDAGGRGGVGDVEAGEESEHSSAEHAAPADEAAATGTVAREEMFSILPTRVSHKLTAHLDSKVVEMLAGPSASHAYADAPADLEPEPSFDIPPVAAIGPMEIVPAVVLDELDHNRNTGLEHLPDASTAQNETAAPNPAHAAPSTSEYFYAPVAESDGSAQKSGHKGTSNSVRSPAKRGGTRRQTRAPKTHAKDAAADNGTGEAAPEGVAEEVVADQGVVAEGAADQEMHDASKHQLAPEAEVAAEKVDGKEAATGVTDAPAATPVATTEGGAGEQAAAGGGGDCARADLDHANLSDTDMHGADANFTSNAVFSEDGENAAGQNPAQEPPVDTAGAGHPDKDAVGGIRGMHVDDVGGLGVMDADADDLLQQDLPMDALDATVDMMLQQQLCNAPDSGGDHSAGDKLAEHAMELHGPGHDLPPEVDPCRERGAAAASGSGDNPNSGLRMPQDPTQQSSVEQRVSSQVSKAETSSRAKSASQFTRAPQSLQCADDVSPVSTGVERAALEFPMSPGVPLIGYNKMRRQSSSRSRQ